MNGMPNEEYADSVRTRPSSRAVTRWVKVGVTQGLHMRACSAISGAVRRHQAKVCVWKGSQCAHAGSVLDLLLLDAPQGTVLLVEAEGKDALESLQAVAELLGKDALERC